MARQALEDAREGIADLLGADLTSSEPDTLIFTSGGTEANNLALFGLAGETPSRVAVSAIEHPSVAEPAKELRRRGFHFVGSTICYAFLQAVGVVNDHLVTCFRHRELARGGRRARVRKRPRPRRGVRAAGSPPAVPG